MTRDSGNGAAGGSEGPDKVLTPPAIELPPVLRATRILANDGAARNQLSPEPPGAAPGAAGETGSELRGAIAAPDAAGCGKPCVLDKP